MPHKCLDNERETGEDILGIQTDTAKCPAVFLVEESRKSYDKGSRKETTDPLGEQLKPSDIK